MFLGFAFIVVCILLLVIIGRLNRIHKKLDYEISQKISPSQVEEPVQKEEMTYNWKEGLLQVVLCIIFLIIMLPLILMVVGRIKYGCWMNPLDV